MVCRCFLDETHQWTSLLYQGLGLHSWLSHGEMELKVDKRRSVILWLGSNQLLNDPSPLPNLSFFQISHQPPGLSGQHHVDHRPLDLISPPSPCLVSLNPLVKRPRPVPFHISFGLVSGLSSVFVVLPCSTPWWLNGAEFPLLWCSKKSPDRERINCNIYYRLLELHNSWRCKCSFLEWLLHLHMASCINKSCICVYSYMSCLLGPRALSQRKQSCGGN